MSYSEQDIEQLKSFFDSITLPETIKMGEGVTITDPKRFLDSHISTLRSAKGSQAYDVFYTRLLNLKKMLSKGE